LIIKTSALRPFLSIALGLWLPSDTLTYLIRKETFILFVIDFLQDQNTGRKIEVTRNSRLLGRCIKISPRRYWYESCPCNHRYILQYSSGKWHVFCLYLFFSSPEHKVLRVSYCDRTLSVVVRRASSVIFLAHLSTKCSGWAIVIGLCPSSVVVRRASCVVRRA